MLSRYSYALLLQAILCAGRALDIILRDIIAQKLVRNSSHSSPPRSHAGAGGVDMRRVHAAESPGHRLLLGVRVAVPGARARTVGHLRRHQAADDGATEASEPAAAAESKVRAHTHTHTHTLVLAHAMSCTYS